MAYDLTGPLAEVEPMPRRRKGKRRVKKEWSGIFFEVREAPVMVAGEVGRP